MPPIAQKNMKRSPFWLRWRRFRRQTQGSGVAHLLHLLLSFLLPRRLFRFDSVHIIALELASAFAPDGEAAGARCATEADTEALVTDLVGEKGQSDALRRLFDRGSDVWVVERSGKLVAYDICGARTKTFADFILLQAPAGDTWAIEIWVAPEARGQGLAVQLRRRVAQEFRKRGMARILGSISVTNKRSIHAFRKIGAKPIGRLDYFWVFGFGLVRIDGRFRVGRWTDRRPLTLAIPPNHGASTEPENAC